MSLYQIAANVYVRLHRVPGLGRVLDWSKPWALYLIPRLRRPSTASSPASDVRRELQSHQRLIESIGHALEGIHGWSGEQTQHTRSLETRLEHDIAALLERICTLEQHLVGTADAPGIWSRLERIESHQHDTTERLDTDLQRARERTEWVRSEMLYELRHVAQLTVPTPAGQGASPSVPPAARILNPEKLAAAQPDLRLNLGCGHVIDSTRINVDSRELPGVDVVADATALPFDPGSLAEIHAAHLLEHFPESYLKDRLLPYWRTLLRPTGELRLIVPDAEAMLAAHQAGNMSFTDLRHITFGAQDYDGDFHYTMFSPASLQALLHATGFSSSQICVRARPNGLCLEMEVVANP